MQEVVSMKINNRWMNEPHSIVFAIFTVTGFFVVKVYTLSHFVHRISVLVV